MNYKPICFLSILITVLLAACRAENPVVTPPATSTPAPTATPPPEATATAMATLSQTATTVEAAPNQANADVTYVRAVLDDNDTWTFHVTVAHPDTGWDDYADGWDVVTPAGTVLKVDANDPFTRLLAHPHENEQPFTRRQRGIRIPAGVTQVRVRAHDSVDGFGGQEILVELQQDSGPDFEVTR